MPVLRLFLIVYIYVSTFVTDSRSEVFSPQFELSLIEFIEHTIRCRHVPGMTIAVVNGNEQWTRGFGKSDLDADINVNDRTLFLIASLTKAFTSTLLARILNDTNGRFNWTSKLTDMLGPNYRFVDDMRTQNTMLRDILSHRMGLARADIGLEAGYPAEISRESLSRRLRFLPAASPFRDGFMYNNYMYMLAGHVAEKLKNDTWENLVQSSLLEPIGMTGTKILRHPDDVFLDGSAKPFIWRNGKFENGTKELYSFPPIEPAGAILSNSADMAKWIRFNLNKGVLDTGKQLVDKGWLAEAFKSHNHLVSKSTLTRPKFPVAELRTGYGYGWMISSYRGYRRPYHSGAWFAYKTRLWLFPDMNIGIFASVNGPGTSQASNALKTILYYIADNLLGLEPWLNLTTSCTFPEPWKNDTKNDTIEEKKSFDLDVNEYSGTYGNGLFPDVAIAPSEKGTLTFKMNRVSGILYPQEIKDTFKLEIVHPWESVADRAKANEINKTETTNVNFIRESKGSNVTGFVMELEANIRFTKGMSILYELPNINGGSTESNYGKKSTSLFHTIMSTALLSVCLLSL